MSGLSDAEVADRVAQGLTNANTDVKTKSIGRIFAEHALTLFNAINVAMAILVLTTGSIKNMAFIIVVFANLVIGVFQEVRAKRMVDKLTILTAKDVRVLRGGEERSIPISQIVSGDLVIVSHGDQVPADGEVVAGTALLDESLLTGESDNIEKAAGSEVFSGSFVETGAVCYKVTKVGREGYAASISAEAKTAKAIRSEIMDTLNFIIRIGTYALIPIGAVLFTRLMLSSHFGYQEAVLQTVAAVIGMIPQGLVLLTSSVLAIATTRLAMRKVLVQQAYCVETLARVDVLCLDKTGTITTGSMELGDTLGEGALEAAYAVARANEADANETARAILAAGADAGLATPAIERSVPFSSRTKYSGCVLVGGRCLVMGAAQFVLGDDFAAHEAEVRSFDQLQRVLVVAEADAFADDGTLEGRPRVIGFVGIRDEIRSTAAQTMSFFKDQGVELRVISGDDPYTVSGIAAAVGLPDAEHYVDASTLTDDEAIERAVDEARVFGRVTPQMKRELVRRLRDRGHVVAMTGDGVNDVLALKEAQHRRDRARRQRLRAHARRRRGGPPVHQQPRALGDALPHEDRLHGRARPDRDPHPALSVRAGPDVARLDRRHRRALVRARPRAQPRARARLLRQQRAEALASRVDRDHGHALLDDGHRPRLRVGHGHAVDDLHDRDVRRGPRARVAHLAPAQRAARRRAGHGGRACHHRVHGVRVVLLGHAPNVNFWCRRRRVVRFGHILVPQSI